MEVTALEREQSKTISNKYRGGAEATLILVDGCGRARARLCGPPVLCRTHFADSDASIRVILRVYSLSESESESLTPSL